VGEANRFGELLLASVKKRNQNAIECRAFSGWIEIGAKPFSLIFPFDGK